MAYSLQTLSGFETFLKNQGFDNKSTNEIINYLEGLGYTTQVGMDIEPGTNPTFNPNAQADISVNGTVSFAPTGDAKVLIDIDDSHITVTGSNNVAVSANTGNNTIDLNDTGNDKVFLSTGNNTVDTGGGSDTVYGGTGNESYHEGAGSQDDTFYAGTGTNLYVDNSSSSNTFLGAGLSGNDSIVLHNTGTGVDSITLGTGHNTVDAGSSTDNLSIHQVGDGESTIKLGSGTDSVYLATNGGAGYSGVVDSVTAGSGHDTVNFVGMSVADASITNNGKTTTVTFGGQTVDVTASSAPGSDVILHFTDGTINGG